MKTFQLLVLILGTIAFLAFAKDSALDNRLSQLIASKQNETAKLDELLKATWEPLNYCGLIGTVDESARSTYFRFPQKIEESAKRIRNTNQSIASIVQEQKGNNIRKLSSVAIICASILGCGLVGIGKRFFDY